MPDRVLGGELLTYHACIKNNDRVIIKAVVVEGRHGKIVTLHAHADHCKKFKTKE